MSTLNRVQAPEFHAVKHVDLKRSEDVTLNNGMPLFMVNAGTQDVMKLEFIFSGGMRNTQLPIIATAVNDMLDEGTKKRSAMDIAEELDFYGAFIETEVTHDQASFTLWTLNKYLEPALEIVNDVIRNAAFPEKEFSIYRNNRKQKYVVDTDKVSVLARRRFAELLFGDDHAYGKRTHLADFDLLKTSDLDLFHKQYYHAGNGCILAAGNLPSNLREVLNKHFGGEDWKGSANGNIHVAQASSNPQREHLVKKEGAMQSALRVGRVLFNREHTDFPAMQVLNCALGGYFGSRLMANIREDKGYTYGIGSGLASMYGNGYFYISAEVGVDVTNAALKEVYFEIDRLQQDLIPDGELELVRNYMTGVFLRSTDGPFAIADRRRALIGYDLDYNYYDRYLETIQSVSASSLRDLAQKYLKKEDLIELVAGDRK